MVLKLGVTSDDITSMHNHISSKLDCSDQFAGTYRPHVTVAYIEKDEEDPLWFNDFRSSEFDGVEVEIDELVFSSAHDDKVTIPLVESATASARRLLSIARELLEVNHAV